MSIAPPFRKRWKSYEKFLKLEVFPLGFQTNEHCAKGVLPATPRLAAAEVAIPDGMDGTAPSSNCILRGRHFWPLKMNSWNLKKKNITLFWKRRKNHLPPTSDLHFWVQNLKFPYLRIIGFWTGDLFWGSSLFFPDIYQNKKKQMEFPSTNLDRTHQWYLGPWRVVHLENLPWSFAFSDGFFSRIVRVCTSLSWSQAFQGTNISAYFHSPKHTPEI